MNPIFDTLCTDHANFGKLLNVIEEQAAIVAQGDKPDLRVLSAAGDYLVGYPAIYHHPIEDLIAHRLARVAPDTAPGVDRMIRDHINLGAALARFRNSCDEFSEDPAEFCAAAEKFIEAQWAHMEFERAALFPAILRSLREEDWEAIRGEIKPLVDPLFGANPDSTLLAVREKLLRSDSKGETSSILANAAV